MRILQLHDETWDSGLSHYALTLSAELKRRGHDVKFWAAPGSHAAHQARFLGLATRELAKPWLTLPARRAELRREGFHLVNAHTGSAHSLAVALSAGTHVPVVRTRGDARPPKGHALARALAKRTDLFIAANSAIELELRALFPSRLIRTVHQGLPVQPFSPPAKESCVGILGQLGPVKGHEDLISPRGCCRRTSDLRFMATGHGAAHSLERRRALGKPNSGRA